MEFKSELDIFIAQKMLRFNPLSKWDDGKALLISREFMSSDDHGFFNYVRAGLTVWEGKMFDQFRCDLAEPTWWITEKSLRDTRFFQRTDWKKFRLAIRRVASNTNERTLITTILPPMSVAVHSIFVNVDRILSGDRALFLCALMNSFICDYFIRQQVTSNVTQFAIHLLPMPQPSQVEKVANSLVIRAAQIICTSKQFDTLAQQVGLRDHRDGVTNLEQRAQLRAELDGLIAHLYGLSESEFAHILTTFPIVEDSVKTAALQAYRDVAAGILQ